MSDVRHLIDDGIGGQWEVHLTDEAIVTDQTTVWFRRLTGNLPPAFGVRIWSLRRSVKSDRWREDHADHGIRLTRESARNALDWIETLEKEN